MSRKTQRYSKEFKAEAVRTVLENQLSISEGAVRMEQKKTKNTIIIQYSIRNR
ncbi:transposase, partial [Escherichia coli]|uniref:transposase n=1 Tax=Escherichia coli TaxID=562 RepID=UPI00093FA16C